MLVGVVYVYVVYVHKKYSSLFSAFEYKLRGAT